MKPVLEVLKHRIETQNLCRILIDAREAMIEDAARCSRLRGESAAEIRMWRGDADGKAIQMSKRCFTARTFNEGLEIVKEYVDIQII